MENMLARLDSFHQILSPSLLLASRMVKAVLLLNMARAQQSAGHANSRFVSPCSDLQHRRVGRGKKKGKTRQSISFKKEKKGRQSIRIVLGKNDSKKAAKGCVRTSKRPFNNSSCNSAPGDDHMRLKQGAVQPLFCSFFMTFFSPSLFFMVTSSRVGSKI